MPDVLHLIWQPDVTDDFVQPGHFFLWMEIVRPASPRKPGHHPCQRYAKSLLIWLNEILDRSFAPGLCAVQSLYLPSADGRPLPSPELLSETERPEQSKWAAWKVDCFRLPSAPIQTINELHYRLLVRGGDVRPGRDFLFWFFYPVAQGFAAERPIHPGHALPPEQGRIGLRIASRLGIPFRCLRSPVGRGGCVHAALRRARV